MVAEDRNYEDGTDRAARSKRHPEPGFSRLKDLARI